MAQPKIKGQYSLEGMHDMAANFYFNADKILQFEYY